MARFQPRPAQRQILTYSGGRMGIRAVPGAGKTHTLAALAAQLVTTSIDGNQEVLVVTLMNSAVDNLKSRIREFIGEQGLLGNVGYRVRTLHGLAHDIVRERPGLVGLAEDFDIVDEREADQIRDNVVEMWLRGHPDEAERVLHEELTEQQQEWAIRSLWPDTVRDFATVFIKRAKDRSQSPEDLQHRLQQLGMDLSSRSWTHLLAETAIAIYADYQKALYYRGGVDFDDLIRLAIVALKQDLELLARLRFQWPFILEDEAQDSSYLQETILNTLAGPAGNWVRVGDPNQAINTTFTTADPCFLKTFLDTPGVTALPLKDSGRSQQCIIDLANYLVKWTMDDHPEVRVRDALYEPPLISPTSAGDPQPNPPADPMTVHLSTRRRSPDAEINAIVQSLSRWLPAHPKSTVAVLVPRNKRGFEMADALRRAGIPYIELLRSTSKTRETAGVLGNVLRYLSEPSSASQLARVFQVWRRHDREQEGADQRLQRLTGLIRSCHRVEEYLWPRANLDWLQQVLAGDSCKTGQGESLGEEDHGLVAAASDRALLEAFRDLLCRWQAAAILPIDQLVLTIAQSLFVEPSELALSHKLAVMLRAASDQNPEWRLPELTAELALIARNQRRFLGFDDEGANESAIPGKVTVSTLHKAKGLEWDRVYIASVNNYDFPSAQPYDDYISERWFVRDRLNLEAEVLAQLDSLLDLDSYHPGQATNEARLDYVRERLRLLYVGITRAKKELILTWNTGRSRREPKQMAVPLIALHTWWEDRQETR